MSDFETVPVGTKARLAELEAYAREASTELAKLAGADTPLLIRIGGEVFVNPIVCAARIEAKLRNARRFRGPSGQSGSGRR